MFVKILCSSALLSVLLLDTKSANAVAIESTEAQYEPGGVRFFFTVSRWENTGVTFCDDMTAKWCHLHIQLIQSTGQNVASSYNWRNLTPTRSMTEVRQQMTGFSIPFNGSIFVPDEREIGPDFCIGFMQGYSYPNAGSFLRPAGPCAPVVKPAVKCEINGNSTIDHRAVFDNAIDGKEAVTTLRVKCTGGSSVIATASKDTPSGVPLRKNGSLYSKLTIDGKDPANGIPIKVEAGVYTPISLKSTLFSKGTVEPGAFSGSTVLTISPP